MLRFPLPLPFTRPVAFSLAIALVQACLLVASGGTASAQFEIGAGSRSDGIRSGDGPREERGGIGRDIGTGIGIGIEIGRTIDQSASKPTDGRVSTKSKPNGPKRYGRKDDKKDDKKDGKTGKGDDKKDDKKKDPGQVAVVTSIDDCLMIIEYPPGQIAAPDGATNTDLKGSAAALKASLKGTSSEQTITKDNTINDALKKFTEGGKCCKRIQLFGHGYQDGSLTVPYATSSDTESDKAYHLGGDGMSKKLGKDAFNDFTKGIKDALCKDPKSGKPAKDAEVRIHSCWSADNVKQDHPIAEELSKTGVTTWGYQGVAKFPYTAPEEDDSKREYSPPTPEGAGEYKKLDAVAEDKSTATEKK